MHVFSIVIYSTNISLIPLPFGKWIDKPFLSNYMLQCQPFHIFFHYPTISCSYFSVQFFLWLSPGACCFCVFDCVCVSCACGSSSCPLLILNDLLFSMLLVLALIGGLVKLYGWNGILYLVISWFLNMSLLLFRCLLAFTNCCVFVGILLKHLMLLIIMCLVFL